MQTQCLPYQLKVVPTEAAIQLAQPERRYVYENTQDTYRGTAESCY